VWPSWLLTSSLCLNPLFPPFSESKSQSSCNTRLSIIYSMGPSLSSFPMTFHLWWLLPPHKPPKWSLNIPSTDPNKDLELNCFLDLHPSPPGIFKIYTPKGWKTYQANGPENRQG
jgi:hypothetical protein